MISTSRTKPRKPAGFLLGTLALLISASVANGQSIDSSAPAPLTSNLVDGRMEPLDIGDSRLTRHYYVFSAGPGDLEINVESENLNGDVDLFAANSLRPLVKISVFASSFSGEANKISKSIFLRRQESIVLRIEGRAAGDQAARYRVGFEGPFIAAGAPATSDEKSAPSIADAASPPRPGTRRVNSVGARIEEPPSTATTNTTTESAAEAPRAESAVAAETPVPSVVAPRPATPRRAPPAPRRRTPARRRTAPPATAAATTDSAPEKVAAQPAAQPAAKAKASSPTPPAAPRPVVSTAKAPIPAAVGVRLVVELRDGERLERAMSEVRRVTVERGVLIVVGGDGRTERRPMSEVLRMAIE